MSTAEELDRIAEETAEGANKQAELVNVTFTIVSVELVKFEYQGEARESYIGIVSRDGQEDRYWLSGAVLRRQIDYLVKEGKLPCRVKLIRDADRNGSPYVLKVAGEAEAPKVSSNEIVNGISAAVLTDAELIRQAVAIRGIDEVALALGDLSDRIEVDESGAYTLPLKGLKLTEAASIRSKLRELIG